MSRQHPVTIKQNHRGWAEDNNISLKCPILMCSFENQGSQYHSLLTSCVHQPSPSLPTSLLPSSPNFFSLFLSSLTFCLPSCLSSFQSFFVFLPVFSLYLFSSSLSISPISFLSTDSSQSFPELPQAPKYTPGFYLDLLHLTLSLSLLPKVISGFPDGSAVNY